MWCLWPSFDPRCGDMTGASSPTNRVGTHGSGYPAPIRLTIKEGVVREIHQTGSYSYVFSPYLNPIARVQPGETVAIHTIDAFENKISKPDDVPSEILGSYLNPQTGPIYIEGAEPGDTLKVDIIDIEPTRDWAVSVFVPFFGGLTSTNATRMLQDPLPKRCQRSPHSTTAGTWTCPT